MPRLPHVELMEVCIGRQCPRRVLHILPACTQARSPREDLGAAGHEDAAAALHVHHVGRRVDDAQRTVDLKRLRKRAALKALTQHQLEHVPRRDVALALHHGVQELLLRAAVHVAAVRVRWVRVVGSACLQGCTPEAVSPHAVLEEKQQ